MDTYLNVVTHHKPHYDEVLALFILMKNLLSKDENMGRLLKEVVLIFRDAGARVTDDTSREQHGNWLLGVGGGKFDEHPSATSARKKNECTASLVAKHLAVDKDPALRELLKYALNNDLKAGGSIHDIAHVMTVMYQEYTQLEVIEWALKAIDARYKEQQNFWQLCQEFKAHNNIEIVNVPRTLAPYGHISFAVVSSDSPSASKAARYVYSDLAIVVQQNSIGQVQIFTNRKIETPIGMIAEALKEMEGSRTNDSTIAGERWHYFPEAGLILNGSLTARGVEPTELSIDEIKTIIEVYLTDTLWTA